MNDGIDCLDADRAPIAGRVLIAGRVPPTAEASAKVVGVQTYAGKSGCRRQAKLVGDLVSRKRKRGCLLSSKKDIPDYYSSIIT